MNIGQLQSNVYNGFLHSMGIDPQQHGIPYNPSLGGGDWMGAFFRSQQASFGQLRAGFYNSAMQRTTALTPHLQGMPYTTGAGNPMWGAYVPYSYVMPQPVQPQRA